MVEVEPERDKATEHDQERQSRSAAIEPAAFWFECPPSKRHFVSPRCGSSRGTIEYRGLVSLWLDFNHGYSNFGPMGLQKAEIVWGNAVASQASVATKSAK